MYIATHQKGKQTGCYSFSEAIYIRAMYMAMSMYAGSFLTY